MTVDVDTGVGVDTVGAGTDSGGLVGTAVTAMALTVKHSPLVVLPASEEAAYALPVAGA